MSAPSPPRFDAHRRAMDHAPFLRGAARRHPEVEEHFLHAGADAAVGLALDAQGATPEARWRRRRDALALALALADLSGEWDLRQVTRALSDFADQAIDAALAGAIDAEVPGAPLEGMTAIALGKLGSRELNYSSDVDLILLYDPDRLPRHPRREPGDTAVRIARGFVARMQERTPEGYVARVDLRLRPASEATPIALSLNAAISHYESAALGWERAAFIRARAAGGDRLVGQRFLEAVQPFVWRRAIDFGVIDEIRTIAGLVRTEYAGGQTFGPGFDLKRGRGGIREIEFFAQSLQMIHGGRDPDLRAPATLDALGVLALAGHLEADEADALAAAYRGLRDAEHRLQMVDDRQTHSLPEGEALDNVARLAGADDGADWLARLRPHVEAVAPRFDELVAEQPERLPREREALVGALEQRGMGEGADAARLIAGWRAGKARSLRTAAAREAFEAMLPNMVEAIAAAPDPVQSFNRFADIVERVPSAINLYRLLEAEPRLATLLARILAFSPALAAQLARRPQLIDGLLDKSAFDPPGSAGEIAARLTGETVGDYGQALDEARRRVNEKRFALGVQLIDAAADPLDVARGYADVAEGAVQALTGRTRHEFELTHGKFDGEGLAVVGLGRLGGRALTHASDLDLVFLYDPPTKERSDGPRPLTPADYYNRLASRIVAALSVPTAAGPLYEVDTRLRPEGLQGALAVSLPGFVAYQCGQAWTWEHMALTRARTIAATPAMRRAIEAALERILTMPRDAADVARDARTMRADMMAHKPPHGPLDLKLGPGGLIDLEFGMHVRQLSTGVGLDPDLRVALERLIAAGEAPGALAADHDLLTRMLVLFRLVAPDSASPSRAARGLVAERLGFEDWDAALAAHEAARQRVSTYWKET